LATTAEENNQSLIECCRKMGLNLLVLPTPDRPAAIVEKKEFGSLTFSKQVMALGATSIGKRAGSLWEWRLLQRKPGSSHDNIAATIRR
jgi:hypothetical protein